MTIPHLNKETDTPQRPILLVGNTIFTALDRTSRITDVTQVSILQARITTTHICAQTHCSNCCQLLLVLTASCPVLPHSGFPCSFSDSSYKVSGMVLKSVRYTYSLCPGPPGVVHWGGSILVSHTWPNATLGWVRVGRRSCLLQRGIF